MAQMPLPSDRSAGRACLAGGVLTVAGAAVVGVVTAGTSVPDDLWRYPWTAGPFVAFSLFAAVLHVLTLLGLAALLRSGVAGGTRAARVGGALAVAGIALLFVGEFASLPVAGQTESASGANLVGWLFGIASLLATAGLLSLGVATVRAHRWADWRPWTPLACGLSLLIAVPLQFSTLLWAALIPYGCAFAALGLALTGSPARVVAPARA
jgi:hypothetical protein